MEEASSSDPPDTSRGKINEESIQLPDENLPKPKRKKQLPRITCKKIFKPHMSVNKAWLESNKKFLQRKDESKGKRKRDDKETHGRWTRSDERNLVTQNHKRIKQQQAATQQKTNNEDKEKENVIDLKEECGMNESVEKQKHARATKNKEKEKVVDENEMNDRVQKQSFDRVLKVRATITPLFQAMRGLSPQRKRVIREMGFGDLIDFPIVEIPTKLAFYVVDILNTRKMTLECPTGDIVITPKTVREVLGMPMGRRKLEREGQREYNDAFLLEWKDQFKNVNKITIKALSDLIIDTKNSDYMFRMNILTLIANTLGGCDNSSTLKFTVLKNVFEGDDVSDIDWCSYILECACVSKLDWSKKKKKNEVVYYGPVMFLMLTYLHYTKYDMLKVKRRVPALKSWNTRLLKRRQISELENEYMGIGEIISDDAGEKEEEYQKEEIYEIIEDSIESILIDKAEIEEKINENLIKFENDERLIQLKERMKEIFKEPYIPKYDTSSTNEDDDDDDDNSQVGDESYGTQSDSVEEDHIQTETTFSDDEIIKDDNAECSAKKDDQEAEISKKEDGDTTKAEAMENEKATDQKNNVEIDPSDEPFNESDIFEEFIRNEHLYDNTQKSAEKQEKHMKNKEKEKQENRNNISSSQDSPVFGTTSWRQGSHPSFDLGASPSIEKMQKLLKNKKKLEKEKETGPKKLKSKYVRKTVSPSDELTDDEKLLSRSIFSMQGNKFEEVFNNDENRVLLRMNIQTLAPKLEIDTSVIDAYVSILNFEEKSKMTNMTRHFFYTSMMVPGILEKKTKDMETKIATQYTIFNAMILLQMKHDHQKLQMEDVELAFFPIIDHGDYYLIVFNLNTGKAVIIDNSESDATYEGKYKDNVDFVRAVFGMHLRIYGNGNAKKILENKTKATIMRMAWNTRKEKKDCGLYMIMHMELYEGLNVGQWRTGLLPEDDKKHEMQMTNLRSRIAAKLLLHPSNVSRKKMSDYAINMTGAEGGSNQQ